MAKSIAITDNLSSIQFVITDTVVVPPIATSNILKSDIKSVELFTSTQHSIMQDMVVMELGSHRYMELDWNLVTVPTVTSAADLYTQLLAMWLNVPAQNIFTQTATFTNASLVANVLTITHAFATTNVFITIKDPSGAIVGGLSPVVVDNAHITIDFGGAIGAGSWTYILIAIV